MIERLLDYKGVMRTSLTTRLINKNIILTRYQIGEHLNQDFDTLRSSNLVDAHIKNLRKKLGLATYLTETVRGVGFTIKVNNEK